MTTFLVYGKGGGRSHTSDGIDPTMDDSSNTSRCNDDNFANSVGTVPLIPVFRITKSIILSHIPSSVGRVPLIPSALKSRSFSILSSSPNSDGNVPIILVFVRSR